jgi:TP901 family phage tail tape measure protein
MKELFKLAAVITMEGLEDVRKGLTTIDKEAKRTTKTLTKVGEEIAKIGVRLTKAITLPVAGLSAAVLKFGSDFDQAMTNSMSIMGNLSDAMKRDLAQTARDVSKQTVFSAKQLAEAYEFLASAGYDATQSMKILPVVAKFAQAGNFDLARATTLAADSQKALGLASKDTAENIANLTRISDVLIKANTLANGSAEQFAEALTNKAAAALRLVNKSVEEGVAVLAVYADQGTKGAAAGESLNIVMRDLQKTSINNKAVFEQFRVSVYDTSGNMRHMADIIADLEKALSGMSDEQKRAALMTLGFQDRSVSAIMTLIGMSDAIRNYETQLRQASGFTEDVANKRMESFNNKLKALRNILVDAALGLWEVAKPVINDTLIPAFEKGVKKISEFVKWFADLPKVVQTTALKITLLVAALGPFLTALGKTLTLFKELKIVIKSVNLLLRGNPFGVAAVAITGIAVAVNKTVSAWQKWKDEIGEKVERKQVEQMTRDVSELIALYAELEDMRYGAIIDDQRFKEASDRIKELETNLADLGYEFTGSFGSKLQQAEGLFDKLTETTKENTKEVKTNAETVIVDAEAIKKLNEEQAKLLEKRRKLLEDRSALEDEYANKVFEQHANDIEILDKKYREELLRAEELGADKLNIEKWYQTEKQRIIDQAAFDYEQSKNKEVEEAQKTADRIAEIDKELAETRKRLEREVAEERREKASSVFYFIDGVFRDLGDVISGFNANRMTEINNWERRQIEAVQNSTLSEEEKQKKMEEIEKKAELRQKAFKRKQAVADKALGIFSVVINTAQAIMKGFASLPPWAAAVNAAVVGALGTIQAGVIAAQPIPLAEGAYLKGSEAGIYTNLAERNTDEIVFPVEKGVDIMANKLASKLAMPEQSPVQPSRIRDVHVHISSMIPDDAVVKKVGREIERVMSFDRQRLGATA